MELILSVYVFCTLTRGTRISLLDQHGAVAISTLAGASLVLNSDKLALFHMLSPFIIGVTLLFWAVATWRIPYLLLLGAWRHIIRRVKFEYDPQYWGMVFPLGMYTTRI